MLSALRRSALLVSAGLTALFGLVAWNYIVDRAEAQAQNSAALIEEYMLRLIQTQEVVLTAADEALRGFTPLGGFDMEAHIFLRELSTRIDGNIGIAFVRSDGEFLVSSLAYPAVGNVGERPYLRETPEEGVYIDRLRVQPTDTDAIVVARRPRSFEGAPGTWVSAARIEVVTEFLQRLAVRDGEAASVLREDGVLLVRNLPLEAALQLDLDSPVMQVIRELGGGLYRAEAITDGRERIYATARVGDMPIFVNFGISLRTLFREWVVAFLSASVVIWTLGLAAYLLAQYAERSLRAEAAQAATAFDRRLLAEAEKTAAVKETMLRELNHRVKNSLQMIQALIRLQRGRPKGPDLEEIGARVAAIATIHDLLYQSAGDFEVDFAEILRRIGASPAVVPPESNIQVVVKAEPLPLDAGAATSLSLCVVELVTNAGKHAFGAEGGTIEVALSDLDDGSARLIVADGGRGMPGEGGRRSGIRVVEALVRQLDGSLLMTGDGGTRAVIHFPVTRTADRTAAGLAAS